METPERVADIRVRTGLPVIKVIHIGRSADVALAETHHAADHILFDAKATPDAALPGGNGVAFDWRVLGRLSRPFALSGGLNPGNVADALRQTGATMVDVSSGVETAPGVKDAGLIAKFVETARAADLRQARAS